MQIDFSQDQDSVGITVIFDQETNEYAEEFGIYVYDSAITLIDSDVVTGNTLSKYIWEQNLSGYRRILIQITKWKSAYRFARITEVDFGIINCELRCFISCCCSCF